MPTPPPLDFPLDAAFTLATLEHTHALIEMTPNGDASIGYALAVPKTWTYAKSWGPVVDEFFLPKGIGYFNDGVERGSPVVSITVTRMPFEMPIDAWAHHSVAAEGWTVLKGAWFPGPHGLMYDVAATRVIEDVELVRRTTVRADANRMFGVHTICSREHWEEQKEQFWVAHLTFNLKGPTGEYRMEPWLGAKADEPGFGVMFPRGWFPEVAPVRTDGISGIHLRLPDPEGETLMAYMLVRAERRKQPDKPSLGKLLESSMPLLRPAGIEVATPLSPIAPQDDPRAKALEGWVGGASGPATMLGNPIELRLGYMVEKGIEFTFLLCSPSREANVITALRAQRAFEIVRSELEVIA